MVHTKCAGFNSRKSDGLAKGKNLNYCCDACLVVANETKFFMSQTTGRLKELINSLGVVRDSFRRSDDVSALNSSPKRKKAAGGRLPKAP